MLNDLYKKQDTLDNLIITSKGLEGENLLPHKIIWLIAELGEFLNELRTFKYASENRKPRTKIEHMCPICNAQGTITDEFESDICDECNGTGKLGETNPLLAEYTDMLFFLLSIGNHHDQSFEYHKPRELETETLIIGITNMITQLATNKGIYQTLMNHYWYLGEKLGFTETDVREQYERKYEENVRRQEVGY